MGSEPDLDSGALLCSPVVYRFVPQQGGHNEAMYACGASGNTPRHWGHVGACSLPGHHRWGHNWEKHQGVCPTGHGLFMSLEIVHMVYR
jgi:hypothetical protein